MDERRGNGYVRWKGLMTMSVSLIGTIVVLTIFGFNTIRGIERVSAEEDIRIEDKVTNQIKDVKADLTKQIDEVKVEQSKIKDDVQETKELIIKMATKMGIEDRTSANYIYE